MIRAVFSTYILFVCRTLIPLIILPLLSAVLSVDGVGVVLAAQSLGLIGGLIIQFGFHQTAARELGANSDPTLISEIVLRVFLAQIITSGLAIVCVTLAATLTPALASARGGVEGAIVITLGTGLSPAWYFRGMKRPALGVLIEIVGQIISFALIVAFVRSPKDIAAALFFSGLGPLVSSVAGILWIIHHVKLRFQPNWLAAFARLTESFPLFLVRISSTGFTMGAAWIAALLTSPRETAYFGVAAKIAGALTTFSQPVLFALLPVISREATLSIPGAIRMGARWGGALLILGLGAAAGVQIFADLFIDLLFADDMAPAATVTRMLAWICVIAALKDTLGDLILVPLHQDKLVALCVILGSGAGLMAAMFLAPDNGAIGMVWSRLLGEMVVVALMAVALPWVILRRSKLSI